MFASKAKQALDLALSWVSAQKTHFALPDGNINEEALRQIKPIGELSLVLSKLSRAGVNSECIDELLTWAWKEFDEGEFLLRILTAKPDLIVLSTVYASFKEVGLYNHRLEKMIQFLANTDACLHIEFPTWRRLDVYHALNSIFPSKKIELSLSGTWIDSCPQPWMITDDLSYATTHSLFYVTDYGNTPHKLSDRVRRYLELWLPVWVERSLLQNNFDLYAEWLMVAKYCGFESLFSTRLPSLLSQQRNDGSFPGPAESAAEYVSPEDDSTNAYFWRNYHTTLVGILALT